MIKIGDFSKIGRVPVKTLRYYDELGLLKPVHVDPFTSYRYYSAAQFARLSRILALKDLGLTLEQIGMLLDGDLPAEQMLGILRRRQVELRQEMSESQAMLARVEARLREFEQENPMSQYEIAIKNVPPMWVASVRGKVPTYPEQGPLWRQLEGALGAAGIKPNGPCFVLDHDDEFRERDHDLEACEPIPESVREMKLNSSVIVRQLEGVETMASTVHHGPFNTLYQAYPAITQWIEDNGYQICGVGREIYIYTGEGHYTRQDDPSYVTEIQFPVKRAA